MDFETPEKEIGKINVPDRTSTLLYSQSTLLLILTKPFYTTTSTLPPPQSKINDTNFYHSGPLNKCVLRRRQKIIRVLPKEDNIQTKTKKR